MRRQSSSAIVLILCVISCLRCKPRSTEKDETDVAPKLALTLLQLEAEANPRSGRPFIAGETAIVDLQIEGGRPPYEVQVATHTGDPTLANASTTIEAQSDGAQTLSTQVGLGVEFGAEVPSGEYAIIVRVSDAAGQSGDVRSEKFSVVGSGEPVRAPSEGPLKARLVDVAGRGRIRFFQGERISVRARLEGASQQKPQEMAIAIVADDERPFMPKQVYKATSEELRIDLEVPRLARIGHYRLDLATKDAAESLPFDIVGRAFPAARKPVLSDLELLGGPKSRTPLAGILPRGTAIVVEALAGGITNSGRASLRLRNTIGKQLLTQEFAPLVPADPHPEARTLVRGEFTIPTNLPRGRYMLEVEIEEAGSVSTVYREVALE